MNKTYNKLLALIVLTLVISACGPVNRFTRVKKIPRQYSLNYCGGEEIKAPKTDLNKQPWIVYSDREKNISLNKPGGKVKAKDVDYLDPFLVIKKKGDYLKLIKYTPDILKNGKLQYKNAEYYGWMLKSKLLLNHQSVTDIFSGKKKKMMVVFSDTTAINDSERYFSRYDAVKLYKDVKIGSIASNIFPYSIVYQLKEDKYEKKSLVAKKTTIKPEEVKQEVLGWIDNSLIQDIGQVLHADISSIPKDQIKFSLRNNRTIGLTENIQDLNKLLSDKYRTVKYNPITSYSARNGQVAYKANLAMPVFDISTNYIFNINGGHITYKKFREISKDLRNINVVFVFEGKQHTIGQFPQLVNALQNLQTLFEHPEDPFNYRFGCVMTMDDLEETSVSPTTMGFTSNYSDVINYLTEKANNKDKLKPIYTTDTWTGVHKAAEMFKEYPNESNLLVLIGETGYMTESVDTPLISKLVDSNIRVVGFQTYATENNISNNFVLDIQDMIDSYAEIMKKTKGEILVSPEQIRHNNYYTQSGDARNGYRLDFPKNSITQGAILFPQKGGYLSLEVLTNNVDTIVQQIKEDNVSISQYMVRAFETVGNNRTSFDPLFAQNFRLDASRAPSKQFISDFRSEVPGWILTSDPILLTGVEDREIDYYLMASENEMDDLKDYVRTISSKEVEQKYKAKKKKAEKKPCNCEDDLLTLINSPGGYTSQQDNYDQNYNNDDFYVTTSTPIVYANTSKIRKHLKKYYIKTLKHCKLCKLKSSFINSMSLAEAQRRITGSPSSNDLLHRIRVKDITNKKIVTDQALDELILYFKSKKVELDDAEKIESNGEFYYWVDRDALP